MPVKAPGGPTACSVWRATFSMKELVWNSALQPSTRNQTHVRVSPSCVVPLITSTSDSLPVFSLCTSCVQKTRYSSRSHCPPAHTHTQKSLGFLGCYSTVQEAIGSGVELNSLCVIFRVWSTLPSVSPTKRVQPLWSPVFPLGCSVRSQVWEGVPRRPGTAKMHR